MKTNTAVILASILSVVAASPIAQNAAADCPAEAPATTSSTTTCTVFTKTVMQAVNPAPAATPAGGAAGGAAATGKNVQTFTGALGGAPPDVTFTEGAARPFDVKGDTFLNQGAALARSCDVQHNACANAANSGKLSGGVGQCETQNTACKAAIPKRKIKRALTPMPVVRRQAAALDLGSCSDPTIVFKDGLDGRQQAAFIANNQKDFNHGSALNIGVVSSFICQRLSDSCKAPQATQDKCKQADTAAKAAKQDQSAADAFNAIMGGGAAAAAPPATPATGGAKATGAANNNNNGQECQAEAPAPTNPPLATMTPMLMVVTSCS